MLVLSRRVDQSIHHILDEAALKSLLVKVQQTGEPAIITSTLLRIKGSVIRVGTNAPDCVRIVRAELGLGKPQKAATSTSTSGESVE